MIDKFGGFKKQGAQMELLHLASYPRICPYLINLIDMIRSLIILRGLGLGTSQIPIPNFSICCFLVQEIRLISLTAIAP